MVFSPYNYFYSRNKAYYKASFIKIIDIVR